jgi:hypothetical protein
MNDQPQPYSASLPPAPGAPTGSSPTSGGPGDYRPGAPGPTSPPMPPPQSPRKSGKGLLVGCLGALVLVLLLGVAAVGVVAFKGRETYNRVTGTLSSTPAPTVAVRGPTAPAVAVQATTAPPAGAQPLGTVGPRGTASGQERPSSTVAAAATSGTGAVPAPTSRPAAAHPAGLNQPVNTTNWTLTVTNVDRPGKALVWSNDDDMATATGTWVIVVVTVKKTSNSADGVAYGDIALRSSQGFTYAVPEDYWTAENFYPTFKHGQPYDKAVPPGATVTYYLPFDVASDATDLQFIFMQDPNNPATFAVGNTQP